MAELGIKFPLVYLQVTAAAIHSMRNGATFVSFFLYVPVLFADNARCQFATARNSFPLAFLLCFLKQCREISYTVIR